MAESGGDVGPRKDAVVGSVSDVEMGRRDALIERGLRVLLAAEGE